MHGLWLLPNNVYGAWAHHTNLIQCLSLPLPLIHPPLSIFKRGQLCGGKGWTTTRGYEMIDSIFLHMKICPNVKCVHLTLYTSKVHALHPCIHPSLLIHPRTVRQFQWRGRDAMCDNWRFQKKRTWVMAHGVWCTWPYDMGPIILHPKFSQLSIHPSSKRVCHWTTGLYMDYVWIRAWASPTFQHTRSHKVHIQMRLTSKTSHPFFWMKATTSR